MALNPPSAGLLCTRFSQVYSEPQPCSWGRVRGPQKCHAQVTLPFTLPTVTDASSSAPVLSTLCCHCFTGSTQYMSVYVRRVSSWPQCAFLSRRMMSVLSQGCPQFMLLLGDNPGQAFSQFSCGWSVFFLLICVGSLHILYTDQFGGDMRRG